MLINELFTNLSITRINTILRTYRISVPENFNFTNINIVIGANGSGKTRFLNAIKELYDLDKSAGILYGYFPSLSDRKITPDIDDHELPESTLYDSMYMEDVSFSDFFKEIEAHSEEFIPELLEYHSQRQKMRGEKALNIIQENFLLFTGKELVIQEKKIYIKGTDNTFEPLSTALSLLSPGELILFYMSIFLAIQQNGKKNKIIILDEPESHLHPKALIDFVKSLTQYEFKEIWIATHCLFLVPEFQFENIIYINDSQVQRRTSRIYQNVFSDLLGKSNSKTKMFFSSLSQWQYCEFIAECFTNPTVIDAVNPNDEQVQLFIQYLKSHHPFNVLDCGGGSGRLGLSLEAAQIGETGNISYEIYDKNPTYTGDKFCVYTNLNDIKNTYNCVVMMNFLHEVKPNNWHQLFHQIYDLLSEDAYLFFVEVTALAQGELPNDMGYFIFGKEELEILFCASQGLLDIKHKEKQKSSCVLIPKKFLCNINQETIQSAIKHLEIRMLNEIKAIRINPKVENEKSNIINPRYYAFLSQQYINAKLFSDNIKIKQTMKQTKIKDKSLIEFIKNSKINLDKIIDMIIHESNRLPFYGVSDMSDSFNEIIVLLKKGSNISEKQLTKCWKFIILLEKMHANKVLIAALLIILVMAGDSRSWNRFENNGYKNYLFLFLKHS